MTPSTDALVLRNVLVTGGSGFIGAHLCRRLGELGVRVHAVSRNDHDNGKNVIWHKANVADSRRMRDIVREVAPDVIYHLAGYVTASNELNEVRGTFQSTLASTVGTLELAVEVGCPRVVMTGSYKELGIAEGAAGSPYAAAKFAGTAYGRMFHHLYDIAVVNLRVFTVYGPGQLDPARLVPHTLSSLLRGESAALTSGTQRLDWVYVDDVVDALVAAGAAVDGVDGEPIEIGSGELTQVRDFVELMAEATGVAVHPAFGALPDRPPEPEFAARLDRACDLLGWRPRIPLVAGIARTVAWYAEDPAGDRR